MSWLEALLWCALAAAPYVVLRARRWLVLQSYLETECACLDEVNRTRRQIAPIVSAATERAAVEAWAEAKNARKAVERLPIWRWTP